MADKQDAGNRTPDPFAERGLYYPLGRYIGAGSAPEDARETLVGRESARNQVRELLEGSGKSGAILVTGHRGAGKTSFVRHCVEEYKNNAFGRFLNGGTGRSVLWDQVLLVAMGGLLTGAALLLYEVNSLLVAWVAARPSKQSPWPDPAWLMALPVVLLCLSPMAYAARVARVALKGDEGWLGRLGAPVGVLLIAALAWFVLPTGAPALSAAYLLLVVATVVLGGMSDSASRWLLPLCSALLAACSVWDIYLPPLNHDTSDALQSELSLLLGTSGSMIAAAWWRRRSIVQVKDTPSEPHQRPTLIIVLVGIAAVMLLGWTAIKLWPHWTAPESRQIIYVPMMACVFMLTYLGLRRPETVTTADERVRAGRYLLLTKALVATVLALQLAHPALSWAQSRVMDALHIGAPLFAYFTDELDAGKFNKHIMSVEPASILRLPRPLAAVRGADLAQSGAGFSTRVTRWDELLWMLGLVLIGVAVFLAEYEHIIRPADEARRRPSSTSAEDRHLLEMARETLPWWVFNTWHPVLVVGVNLGFDQPEHGRVIQSMLVSLRDLYHREFLSWHSGFANTRRLLILLLSLMVATQIGDWLFHVEGSALAEEDHDAATKGAYCSAHDGPDHGKPMLQYICAWLGEERGGLLVQALYFPDVALRKPDRAGLPDDPALRTDHLACVFLPCSPAEGKYLHLYHLLVFAVVVLIARSVGRELWFAPYSGNLARLDALLDQLTSSRTVKEASGLWQPIRLIRGVLNAEKEEERQVGALDPRVVEATLLDLLQELQTSQARLISGLGLAVALPSPDLVFIFDELDKLGLRTDTSAAGGGAADSPDQRRSDALHRLLADMKNLLSTAPARFFFVGGRDLHDEWLADQTDRRPLLTNIFQGEVYLPSLVVDPKDGADQGVTDWAEHIRTYLAQQMRGATAAQTKVDELRSAEFFALPPPNQASPTYGGSAQESQAQWCLLPKDSGEPVQTAEPENRAINRDLSQFLTYRSIGNPKRLKELVESLVKPRRVFHPVPDACDHILYLSESRLYRIQLIAEIYRLIQERFRDQAIRRDDKLPLALFFLSDFLIKFHGRAFSWSNLERVDELVHIHRAHDHRAVMEKLVVAWSDRFLHPIRNGMYDFRFRSSMAAEIEHLSRQSEPEMAAFNFTLDEARALKALYLRQIQEMGDGVTHDAYAGLAELYEFDQEFEQARFAYAKAIQILDKQFNQKLSPAADGSSATWAVFYKGDEAGRECLRNDLVWGVARLRLMLQVGMTFELANNMERALAEYRDAQTLSWRLILAMVGESGIPESQRVNALKHLNILFQPLFAEAWIAEKLPLGVDTSLSLVERQLADLEEILPLSMQAGGYDQPDANLALTLAELHNKAGDLYFYKGRQPIAVTSGNPTASAGYITDALRHYMAGLCYLQQFFHHRQRSRTPGTMATEGWSDYMFRLLAGSLTDLAEASLAEQDGLDVPSIPSALQATRRDFEQSLVDWLEAAQVPRQALRAQVHDLNSQFECWLGSAGGKFEKSIILSLTGASMMARCGHLEDAAHQYEQVAELVAEIQWWEMHLTDDRVFAPPCASMVGGLPEAVRTERLRTGLLALEEADRWYHRVRRREHREACNAAPRPGQIGDVIPVSLVVTACSLVLSSGVATPPEFTHLVKRWFGDSKPRDPSCVLLSCFQNYPYPALTRLNALRCLIDSGVHKRDNAMQVSTAATRLISLERQFDSPLHFTNFQSGLTLAMAWFYLDAKGDPSGHAPKIHAAALHHLSLSEEIVTMRRHYYDTVASLNYLYDDFNDRMLHYRHAVQMAGLPITAQLKRLLDREPHKGL